MMIMFYSNQIMNQCILSLEKMSSNSKLISTPFMSRICSRICFKRQETYTYLLTRRETANHDADQLDKILNDRY